MCGGGRPGGIRGSPGMGQNSTPGGTGGQVARWDRIAHQVGQVARWPGGTSGARFDL